MIYLGKKPGLFIILGVMFSGCACAAGFSDVVNTLLSGGSVLTKLMWAVCIVVGVSLIAAAFTQFQIHRRNPKLVPLTTPTLYLILGIAAIALPFLGQSAGFMSTGVPGIKGAPSAAQAPTRQDVNPNDIDAPIN